MPLNGSWNTTCGGNAARMWCTPRQTPSGSAKVYIASSVVEPFIKPFAKRIGAQAMGTPVEIVNGRVRMIGQLMADEKKIEQVLSHLGVERVDIAYGDTILDIPLLEHADHRWPSIPMRS